MPRLALPGERIVRRGERGDAMYFIASGAVEVQRPGEEVVRLGTGDFFGEMALIMRQPRVADVVALSYCRLLMLPREAFRQFLRTHPELMQQVRRSAEERLRQLQSPRRRWPKPERLFHVKQCYLPMQNLAKDPVEHVLDTDGTGDAADGTSRQAQILRQQCQLGASAPPRTNRIQRTQASATASGAARGSARGWCQPVTSAGSSVPVRHERRKPAPVRHEMARPATGPPLQRSTLLYNQHCAHRPRGRAGIAGLEQRGAADPLVGRPPSCARHPSASIGSSVSRRPAVSSRATGRPSRSS